MQTTIVPVSVFPGTANTLYIRAGNLGPPPQYYYQLQAVTVTTNEREVPNPNYVAPALDTDGNPVPYNPASDTDGINADGVAINTTDKTLTETYETTEVVVLKDGNVSMTQAQWDGWSDTVDDTEYQLDCIAANLGLTRA